MNLNPPKRMDQEDLLDEKHLCRIEPPDVDELAAMEDWNRASDERVAERMDHADTPENMEETP